MRGEPADQDAQHLRLLSIFHYLLAGFTILFSFIPVLYILLGWFMLTGRMDSGSSPPPEALGWLMVALGGGLTGLGLLFACGLVLAGRFLARRRHHVFCMVIAAIACTFMPLGTVLGVFSLIVLSRDSVRASFAPGPPPLPVAGA